MPPGALGGGGAQNGAVSLPGGPEVSMASEGAEGPASTLLGRCEGGTQGVVPGVAAFSCWSTMAVAGSELSKCARKMESHAMVAVRSG